MGDTDIDTFLSSLLIFFLLINPIGLVPVFLSLTAGTPFEYRRAMAIKGPIVAWCILIVFALLGDFMLHGLGITIPAFKTAGGLLLGITGLRMVLEFRQEKQKAKAEEFNLQDLDDVSIFPMASLFLAGPGAITAMILAMNANQGNLGAQCITVLAMTIVIAVSAISFVLSGWIARYLPEDLTSVITRVLGMLLVSLSVQLIFDGIKQTFLNS